MKSTFPGPSPGINVMEDTQAQQDYSRVEGVLAQPKTTTLGSPSDALRNERKLHDTNSSQVKWWEPVIPAPRLRWEASLCYS